MKISTIHSALGWLLLIGSFFTPTFGLGMAMLLASLASHSFASQFRIEEKVEKLQTALDLLSERV